MLETAVMLSEMVVSEVLGSVHDMQLLPVVAGFAYGQDHGSAGVVHLVVERGHRENKRLLGLPLTLAAAVDRTAVHKLAEPPDVVV